MTTVPITTVPNRVFYGFKPDICDQVEDFIKKYICDETVKVDDFNDFKCYFLLENRKELIDFVDSMLLKENIIAHKSFAHQTDGYTKFW